METFDVGHWLDKYRGGNISRAKIGTPTWSGACFTQYDKDGKKTFVFGDKTGLVPVRHPSLPYDLSGGFEPEEEDAAAKLASLRAKADGSAYKKEDRMKEPVRILESLKQADVDIEEFDFVFIRKCVLAMAMTAVDPDKVWSMHGKGDDLVNGKIVEAQYSGADKFSLYGMEFERVFREEMKTTPRGKAEEFGMITETEINDMKCALLTNVSCYDPMQAARPDAPDLASIIQMRSRKQPTRQGQHIRAKTTKYPGWWIQSYIVGIEHLHIGNWTPEGMLMHVERMDVEELPQKAREGVRGDLLRKMWTPAIMLEFLHSVLEWMQSIVQTDRDVIYRFTYNSKKKTIEGNPLPGDVSQLLDALV